MKYFSTRGGTELLSFEEVNISPLHRSFSLTDSSGALGRLGRSRAERWFVHPRAHPLSTPQLAGRVETLLLR